MPGKPEAELVDELTEVFRSRGYEGTTISMISEATGLKKSSLYHRFPNGKEQMAMAVMASVGERLEGHILAPLSGSGPERQRVKRTAKRLAAFYDGGRKACLLDALSVGAGDPARPHSLDRGLAAAYQFVHSALAAIAQESGRSKALAERAATNALVELEGALVVARVSGDARPFKQVIRRLPDILCD